MAQKVYDATELSSEWNKDRKAAMLRGISLNNSQSSKDKTRDISVYVASDFQDLGITSPSSIREQDFHAWSDGMEKGLFRGSSLSVGTIGKRVEILRALLRAGSRKEQQEFVNLWKPKHVVKEIRYWSVSELESMDEVALLMFGDEKLRPRAMAHLLHSMMAPRISDTASFRWDSFDMNKKQIKFRASKNKKLCSQYIQDRFLPYIKGYKEWVSQFSGGDEFLFPTSIAQKSGTTKKKMPHISDKTIRKWLAKVRDSTILFDGTKPQKLSSHCYRHSLAMRYLSVDNKFENIAMILGDEIATIEKHYAELSPNKAQEMAFHRAFKKSNVISSEGTAQPEWLNRRRGSNPTRVVDVGGC